MNPADTNEVALGSIPRARLERSRVAIVPLSGGGLQASSAVVASRDGAVHAWINRCPHWGLPLEDGRGTLRVRRDGSLVCAAHGAVFETDRGRCIHGPCVGDALTPLRVACDGELVVLYGRSGLGLAGARLRGAAPRGGDKRDPGDDRQP